MYKKPEGKVVFSGRFDRPHVGHFATILSLASAFKYVCVVLLDYPEQRYPIEYRRTILQDFLDAANNLSDSAMFVLDVNKTHFAKITKEEWSQYGCDWYAAGNWEVLRHMDTIGANVLYVPRSWDYAASVEHEADCARMG